jgi:riboflavin transporter FmnP
VRNENIKKMVLAALFVALGLVLPFLTGQIPTIGQMLLPMHLPIFLCALICGWKYGLAVGIILPVLRSMLFTIPPMYPMALSMAFECGAYGFVAGFLYEKTTTQSLKTVYTSMLPAMLVGRIVWGVAMALLLGFRGGSFGFKAFIAGAFVNAVPGIILQLILIPLIMVALDKAGVVSFRRTSMIRSN